MSSTINWALPVLSIKPRGCLSWAPHPGSIPNQAYIRQTSLMGSIIYLQYVMDMTKIPHFPLKHHHHQGTLTFHGRKQVMFKITKKGSIGTPVQYVTCVCKRPQGLDSASKLDDPPWPEEWKVIAGDAKL